jgi:hypothetical protein
VLLPQIVAYPVYAQYPYSVSGRSTLNSPTANTNNYYGSPVYTSPLRSSPDNSRLNGYPPADSFLRTFNTPVPIRNNPSWPNSYGYSNFESRVAASNPSSFRSNNDQPPLSNMLWNEENEYGRQDTSVLSTSNNMSSYSYPPGSDAAQAVYNPQSLAYPPLLSLNSIPVPNGSLFNPVPPAYSVSVYGSASELINALQTLLAQLLGN